MGDPLHQVLEVVRVLGQKAANGDYIFRGEPRCFDRVSSSLYRDYDEIESESFDIEVIQKEILQRAQKYTLETDEFEILTQLQHYGGKTNLIDFTSDYLIALFFACDGFPGEDGRVILFLKSGASSKYIVQARNPIQRVIAQKSVFVRPPAGFIEPSDTVVVPNVLKTAILDFLRVSHGISNEAVYNDLHGFVRVQDIHKSAYAKFYKGRTLQNKGEYQRAIEEYSQTLELNPQFAAAYNNRGNSYYGKGETIRAIQDYDKAIELDPLNADAYNNRGNARMRNHDLDSAIADHTRSLEIDPNHPVTYYNRGNAYLRSGDLPQAIGDYSKVLELSNDNTAVYARYMRAIAWLRLLEWDKARSDLSAVDEAGIDLSVALGSIGYESVAAFEHAHSVKLPEDLVRVLTPHSN